MKVGNRRRNMESKSFRNFFFFLFYVGKAQHVFQVIGLPYSHFSVYQLVYLFDSCYILGIQIKAVAYILVLYPDAFSQARIDIGKRPVEFGKTPVCIRNLFVLLLLCAWML